MVNNKLLDELTAIKKLMILRLIKDGINAKEIGGVLGITGARIGQMIPVRKIKKERS